jgi:hypothetical protein
LLAPLTVIQLTLLATIQAHPLAVVTFVLPPPPAAPTVSAVDERL